MAAKPWSGVIAAPFDCRVRAQHVLVRQGLFATHRDEHPRYLPGAR